MDIELVGRAGCGLCEEARDALTALGVEFEWVDVDDDPYLNQAYSDRVPVLFVDGKVKAEGRIGPAAALKAVGGR